MNKILMACLLAQSGFAYAATDVYNIDNKHSFANFTIRHVVAKTSGVFTDVTGVVNIDRENLEKSSVNATIQVASVKTGLAKRDDHIQEIKYLDTSNFGEMTFVSDNIVETAKDTGEMTGELTIHGVTKVVTMPFKVLGFGADPWGGERAGFEANMMIKASDYGFTWMQKAGAPVGNEISIHLLIEGIKAK